MKITKENVKTFIASNLLWGISLILILSGWTYALWAKSWSKWNTVTASDFQNLRNDVVYLKSFSEWTLSVASNGSVTGPVWRHCLQHSDCYTQNISTCDSYIRDMGIKSSNISTGWIHYYNDGYYYYKITQCTRAPSTLKILFK